VVICTDCTGSLRCKNELKRLYCSKMRIDLQIKTKEPKTDFMELTKRNNMYEDANFFYIGEKE